MSIVAPAPGILFVCTGNICRSPYLEFSLRAALAGTVLANVSVSSAGTAALEGHSASRPTLKLLNAHGIDARTFRARRLTPQLIGEAGIILTATRDHRRDVTRLDPTAAERTFTVLQLARMLRVADAVVPGPGAHSDPVILLPGVVARALSARGHTTGGEGDDIEDPWHRPTRVYRRAAERMDEGLAPLIAHLTRSQ